MKPEAVLPDVTNLSRFGELRQKLRRPATAGTICRSKIGRRLGAVTDAPYRRLLKESRSIYRANDLSRLLPPGRSRRSPCRGRSYALVLPGDLLIEVYRAPTSRPKTCCPDRANVLREAGYVDLEEDGNWWVPSGRVFYATDESDGAAQELAEALRHFFAVRRFVDPFGNAATSTTTRHDLLACRDDGPVGNVVRAEFDYRVLRHGS